MYKFEYCCICYIFCWLCHAVHFVNDIILYAAIVKCVVLTDVTALYKSPLLLCPQYKKTNLISSTTSTASS